VRGAERGVGGGEEGAEKYMNLPINQILQGDALEKLKELPDESVNCIITSPPYWALRDYGTASWDGGDVNCEHKGKLKTTQAGFNERCTGKKPVETNKQAGLYIPWKDVCGDCGARRVDKQLGLENTPDKYIARLCDIFDEARRVLRKDGTLWVNLGDTYGGTGDKGISTDPKYERGRNGQSKALNRLYKSKSLLQIPSRFSIEMDKRGWILRNEIIWHKPNCMPSSVDDRFTVDFEKIFFFVKSKKYQFTQLLEPVSEVSLKRAEYGWSSDHPSIAGIDGENPMNTEKMGTRFVNPEGRNKRAVWTVNTHSFADAHFATYPEKLVEPMILAGCPEGGIVLDPFFGAGTTGLVAKRLQRRFIGIELNPEYIKIANSRLSQEHLF